MIGRLLLVDAMGMRFRELKLRKDPACPMCGEDATIKELIDYDEFCGVRGEESVHASAAPEIEPEELKRRLDAGEDIFVLDVREPHEYAICNLGGRLIPLGELARRAGELDRDREIVAHCKGGTRSAKAVELLRGQGFTRVRNLAGGIARWAEKVDPEMPRY